MRYHVRRAVMLGTPLVLVLLELFHARNLEPTVYQALSLGVNRWLVVHVAQLVLFGLIGLAIYLLVEGFRGPGAVICGISAGIFALFYGAFDTLAGIAPGILIKSANDASEEQLSGFEAAAQALFESAEVGSFAFLKIIGEIGWFVAVMSAVILLSRTARPLLAFGLLALATFLLPVFQFSYDDLPGIAGFLVVAVLVALVGSSGRAPLPPLIFLSLSAVLLTFGHPAPVGSVAFACFFLGAYFASLSPGGRSGGVSGRISSGRSRRPGRSGDAVY
ncbi:MAG: hypothetical protein WA982_11300 [Rubrobacteraceae bacterium]